jgi:hypothetical protein
MPPPKKAGSLFKGVNRPRAAWLLEAVEAPADAAEPDIIPAWLTDADPEAATASGRLWADDGALTVLVQGLRYI